MTITREEIRATRNKLAREMNDYIINLGDEDIWMEWIALGVPDGPTDEDFEYFEDEETFKELCELFDKCIEWDKEENY